MSADRPPPTKHPLYEFTALIISRMPVAAPYVFLSLLVWDFLGGERLRQIRYNRAHIYSSEGGAWRQERYE